MTGVRTRTLIPYLASVLVCYTLGHELSFLASFGADFDRGLASTGHGSLWAMSVAVVAALALTLLGLAVHRIGVLSRQVGAPTVRHRARRSKSSQTATAPLVVVVLRLWLLVLAPALLLFILSENVEHLASGIVAPGLGVFEGDIYGWAPIAFLSASLTTAAVLGLYRWRHDVLVSQIAGAALPSSPRVAPRRPRPTDARTPRLDTAGGLRARAPPRGLPVTA